MMKKRPPLTSPDGSRNRNTPGRCPRPLYSRDYTQERQEFPQVHPMYSLNSTREGHKGSQDCQVEGLVVVKIEGEEEPYMRGNVLYIEEKIPPEISTDPGTSQGAMKTQKNEEHVRIKEEELPVKVGTDPRVTRKRQGNIKYEKEEECVRIKEEETPIEISTGGYGNGNNQERRCPSPLYTSNSTQKKNRIPQNGQGGGTMLQILDIGAKSTQLSNTKATCDLFMGERLVKVEVKEEPEEPFVRGDEPYREEDIPAEIGTDGRYRSYVTGPIFSLEGTIEDDDITDNSSDEDPITPHIPPPLPSTDPSASKHFPCSECKKSFTREENLRSHQRIHRGEDPLSCPECGKCFIWKRQLVIHQRSHTGEKPLCCSDCGKSFSERSNLVRHQKSHWAERPFACSQCSKCFTDRTKLNNHQRTHTGEKPYSCAECGERFSRKSSLTRHEKFHRGEKPYSCTECGKCFTERANLVTHYRIHTGDRPYSCSKCERAFKQRSDLVRHEKVHMRYQWHFCPECGQQFALKASLITHLSSHASTEVPGSGSGS